MLTARELEVLALLATGATAHTFGDQLQIKPATVKSHLRSVCRTLGATIRVQATRCYLLARSSEATATRR